MAVRIKQRLLLLLLGLTRLLLLLHFQEVVVLVVGVPVSTCRVVLIRLALWEIHITVASGRLPTFLHTTGHMARMRVPRSGRLTAPPAAVL
jgi:hypothetical protein